MPDLRSRLNEIAQDFASAVLDAVRGMSLHDLRTADDRSVGNGRKTRRAATSSTPSNAKPAGSNGRLPRRSPQDIAKALDRVVSLVRKNPDGLRAEQIGTALGVIPKEMPRVLKEGLSKRVLRARGQKRATTYFAK